MSDDSKKNGKMVYACFCTDIIHDGHLNIINEARKHGRLIIGVLTDEAMIQFNRFPIRNLEERMAMIEALDGVDQVIVQEEVLYDKNIARLKPDYVIHGDNWLEGPLRAIRDNAEKALAQYGGQIIDAPYTYSEEVQRVDRRMREQLSMPEYRRHLLKKLIELRGAIKAIEVHSGLTGLIAEKTIVFDGEQFNQFDAMWISSLCDSTAKGKPDIELVDMTSRFRTISDVTEVTTKPIIFDGDTGGKAEHFVYTVRTLERLGVSAIIIEDKVGLKKNSLFGVDVEQTQDSIENFCAKIAAGKAAQVTEDFMIIARIESLILEKGMDDALERAFAYIDAGADAIMIHSRKKDPAEILDFCDRFREVDSITPLVVVPSSYNVVTENELIEHGVNIVIYANQLTRSAFPAMEDTAKNILVHHRAKEVDDRLMPISEIITLIDEI